MARIEVSIQVVSPLGYTKPYAIQRTFSGEYPRVTTAKLHAMQEIRKIAKRETFQFANIVLKTKTQQYIYIMRITRQGGCIYVKTITSVTIDLPPEYQGK